MKPTKAQIAIAYIASALLLVGVFHQPLGVSDTWGIIFPLAAIFCWIAFFVLRRRQKAHGSEPPAITSPVPAAKQKNIKGLSLFLIIAVTLSGPWWLPFTGTRLPFSQMVVLAIVNCIICVTIYLIAWRRAQQKSNQATQRSKNVEG
jgi:preprotein translocase subunit YajC